MPCRPLPGSQISSVSIVEGPRPVYASATARTASSETSNSLPKSPKTLPSPIVRNSSPAGFLPAATVPVPEITTAPQGWVVPARSATNASFTIRCGPPKPSGPITPSRSPRSDGQSTPARPNTEASSAPRRRPAASSAASADVATASHAPSRPAVSQFDEPPTPAPNRAPDPSATMA